MPDIVITEKNSLSVQRKAAKAKAFKRMRKALRRAGAGTAPIERLVVIPGSMKSGTTTLYEYLMQHPQIAPNEFSKEPSYFSGKKRSGPEYPLAYYFAQFAFDPAAHQYALEASTNYMKYPSYSGAFAAMKETGLDFRFICILRDPVDRAESHIKHNIARGRLDLADYRKKLSRGPANTSKYATQIDQLLMHFPRESLLLLSFEALKADPSTSLQRTLDFLELDDFSFAPPERQNTRDITVDGRKWTFDEADRNAVFRHVRDDIVRLEQEYQIPIQEWFPTFARLHSYASRAG